VADLFGGRSRVVTLVFGCLRREGFLRIDKISGSQIVRKSVVTWASEANVSQRAVACPYVETEGVNPGKC
jgi:hypothetical protein